MGEPIKVELFEKSGRSVATVKVPAENYPPEIVLFGGDVFVLKAARYVKAVAVAQGSPA
jgi:hypothetical protein